MINLEIYKDLSGDGGIVGFVILKNAIIIQFDNCYCYLYDYTKSGKEHVEEMKRLARRGKGLKTYINQNIRGNYKDKFDHLPPSLAA